MAQVMYSQRGPWARMPLGSSDVTVGNYGCLLACAAAQLATWGVPTDPERLNAWLTRTGGFYNGNLFIWRSIEAFGVRLAHLLRAPYDEGEQAAMSKVADPEHYGAIFLVDFSPKAGLQPHYVRLLPMPGDGTWPVMDPWQLPGKEKIDLRHYLRGRKPEAAITQIAIYENRVGAQRLVRHAEAVLAGEEHQARLYECPAGGEPADGEIAV